MEKPRELELLAALNQLNQQVAEQQASCRERIAQVIRLATEIRAIAQPQSGIVVPQSPGTTSPVPQLTSIYATAERGPYGKANFPGNCSGYLIRDLLKYFGARLVLDPMAGSGTCQDVCAELATPCTSFDLRDGQDACDPANYRELPQFVFIWLHPPYWRMKRYSDDPRCLSNAPSLRAFRDRLSALLSNCVEVLADGGTLAVLMGDYFDVQQRRQIPTTHIAKDLCLKLGLWPACTDIIRLQHGSLASKKSYARRFIPGLHDTCLLMQRPT
jgi:hypothetical protein